MSVDLSEMEAKEEKLSHEELFEELAAKHRFQDKGKILHIAIIDYLTNFTCFKKVEKRAKSLQGPVETISVAHPNFYGDRFQQFMIVNVFEE